MDPQVPSIPELFPRALDLGVIGARVPVTEETASDFAWKDSLRQVWREVDGDSFYERLRAPLSGPYRRNPLNGEEWPFEILSDAQLRYLNSREISRLTGVNLGGSEIGIIDMYLDEGKPVLVMSHASGGPGGMFGLLLDGYKHTAVLGVDPKGADKNEDGTLGVEMPQYLDDRLKKGIEKNHGFVLEYDLKEEGRVLVAYIFPNPFERLRHPADDYHP